MEKMGFKPLTPQSNTINWATVS